MKIQIRGRTWTIRRGKPVRGAVGHCDSARREIVISPKLQGWQFTSILIHEVLHACFEDLNEDAVREAEAALVTALRNA